MYTTKIYKHPKQKTQYWKICVNHVMCSSYVASIQLVHCWVSAFLPLLIINESPPSPQKKNKNFTSPLARAMLFCRAAYLHLFLQGLIHLLLQTRHTHTHRVFVLGIRTKPYQLEEKLTEDALLHYKCIYYNYIPKLTELPQVRFAYPARRI